MDDYFEIFELPRRLQVDLEDLQRRFYALSRLHHPDFHQLAGDKAQAASLERSALVNRAYRVLRDPFSRVAYVLGLEEGRGVDDGGAIKPQAPMDLLEEMLEVQEALEKAKAAGLESPAGQRMVQERQRLMDRQAGGETTIVERFVDWDRAVDEQADTRPLLVWFRQALAARAYVRTVLDDIDEALGEDREGHVAHRRN
jgi:Fe-S protein assembly co-chaperone HscB